MNGQNVNAKFFLLLSENKSDKMFYDFKNVGRFSLLKVLEMVRKSEYGR